MMAADGVVWLQGAVGEQGYGSALELDTLEFEPAALLERHELNITAGKALCSRRH